MSSFISIIPPLLVLVIAIISRRVILSLSAGIILGSLIATNFSIINSILLIFNSIIKETEINQLFSSTASPDRLYTFFFLIALGIIMSLITKSGGIAAYTEMIKSKLTTKKSTEFAALILSSIFFIDEYLNNLTVGCIIRPLTDKLKIPRIKLAFILNSLGSALCVLIPASSWVAMITANLKTSGVIQHANGQIQYINADPFSVYLRSIPYSFYAFFIIITAYFVVLKSISFGPMNTQEHIAETTGNIFGGKKEKAIEESKCYKGNIIDFIAPISTFLISVAISLLYTGNYWILGGKNNLFQALQNANSFYALFISSVIALLACIILFTIKRKLSLKEFYISTIEGINLVKGSIIVLTLAWAFGNILQDHLHAGEYLGQILLSSLPIFTIPLIIFSTAIIICAATGSSWASISIIIPLAIPVISSATGGDISNNMTLLYTTIGALLSGALVGSHISPITDATIIASTSSGSYHWDHVMTQAIYSLPAIIATIISILIASTLNLNYTYKVIVSLSIGIFTTMIILYGLDKFTQKFKH